MAIASPRVVIPALIGAVVACTHHPPPAPAPVSVSGFRVLRDANPSDTGAPTLILVGGVITIQGIDRQRTDGGLYGDVDSTQRGTFRLTLFDSVPGQTVQTASPAPGWRQVVYEAQFGPLTPGPYDIWVGRWDPKSQTVVVTTQPLHVEVP